MHIFIDATTDLYTTVKILGNRSGADWASSSVSAEFIGSVITGLDFDTNSSGQLLMTIGNITGFSSSVVKFRALTVV